MSEQLDGQKQTPRVSGDMTAGIGLVYLVGAFGGMALFFALDDKPFGTQIATVIVYTYFAFWFVFFPTRGMPERFHLGNESVQKQIPRLLAIHCAFLVLILLIQTILFAMKPQLPSYWFTEHGKRRQDLYGWVLIGSSFISFFVQVFICRRILGRSLEKAAGQSDHE